MSIDSMQQGLEKALAAASQADDRELAGRVRDEGRRVVFLLGGLMRTSRVHSAENAAFDAPSRELASTIRGLMELLGSLHIICVEDQIYVNDIRLRVNEHEQPMVDGLVGELARHDVGGLSFHKPVDAAGIKHIAFAVARPAAPDRPRTALTAAISTQADVELQGTYRFRIGKEPEPTQRDFDESMKRAALVAREAISNLAAGRIPNPLPVRRAVIDLIDGLKGAEEKAALTPLRRVTADVGEQHLLSVTALSSLLGRGMGLAEGGLSDLGVAAMMHDAGYTQVPDRSGHAGAGARMLLRQRGFHEAKLRRVLMVLDHHRPYRADASGRIPSLFARVLHIVDDYDVLTAYRPGQLPALSPANALAMMWGSRGQQYDPDLLAVFVQVMGRFPPGSVLELTDHRWVVATSVARGRERFAHPVVRVIREADGSPCPPSEELDLFELRETLWPLRLIDPAAENVATEKIVEDIFGAAG